MFVILFVTTLNSNTTIEETDCSIVKGRAENTYRLRRMFIITVDGESYYYSTQINGTTYEGTIDDFVSFVDGREVELLVDESQHHFIGGTAIVGLKCDGMVYMDLESYNSDMHSNFMWGCIGIPILWFIITIPFLFFIIVYAKCMDYPKKRKKRCGT